MLQDRVLLVGLMLFGSAALAVSPGEFDDFSQVSAEAWVAPGGAVLAPMSACGFVGRASEECLQVDVSGGNRFTLSNVEQWAGNYQAASLDQVRARVRNETLSPDDLHLRWAIRGPTQEDGGLPTCYVTAAQVLAPGSGFVALPFDLNSLTLAADPACAVLEDAMSTSEVLADVREVRLISSVGDSWSGDAVEATAAFDSIRALADSQSEWRWIGLKSDPNAQCADPAMVLPPSCPSNDWIIGHLFGDPSDPDPMGMGNEGLPANLRQYCIYEYCPVAGGSGPCPGPTQAADVDITQCVEALATQELFTALEPDFLGVTPAQPSGGRASAQRRPQAGGLDDDLERLLYPLLAREFEDHAGRPIDLLTGGGPRISLVFVDSQPPTLDLPPQASLHGYTLLNAANDLLCDRAPGLDEPGCFASLDAAVALTFRDTGDFHLINNPARENEAQGGYIGLVGKLASVLAGVVDRWKIDGITAKLVLNASLGWNPELGGTEADPLQFPVAARAVFDALGYARCEGALPIAAVGNTLHGPVDDTGPILPAAWISRSVDPGSCATPPPGPLLWAAGGVGANNERLFNSRLDGEPPLVAFSDHAHPASAAGDLFGTLTGSSVASAVVSAAAAAVWYYRSDLQPPQVINAVFGSGVDVGRSASVLPLGASEGLAVRRVDVCTAAANACAVAGCATPPACRTVGQLTQDDVGLAVSAFDCGGGTYCPFDLSTLDMEVEDDEICEETISFTGAVPAPGTCPHKTLPGLLARSSVGPQPCSDPCPSCLELLSSPGTLYLQIDGDFEGELRDPLLKCGDRTFRLPETLLPGQNAVLTNADAACGTDSPIWLTARVLPIPPPPPPDDEPLLPLSVVSSILRVRGYTLIQPAPAVAGTENTWPLTTAGRTNAVQLLYRGTEGGMTEVNIGPCSAMLELGNASVFGFARTDRFGNARVSRQVPPGLAGATLSFQALDLSTPTDCAVSNVIETTFQ